MKKVVLFICLILLITGCGNKKKEIQENNNSNSNINDNPKQEEQVKTIDDKEIENGIKVIQTNMVVKNGETELTTELVNESGTEKYIKYIDIIFKDNNDNVIDTLIGYVGRTLQNGESSYIVTSVNLDMSKMKEIEYKINY